MAISGPLTDAKILIGGYDVSADHNKCLLEDGIAIHPATVFGDTGIRRVSGVGDVSMSAAGFWNQDASRGEQVIFPNVGSVGVPVSVMPSGMALSAVGYLFRAGFTEYAPAADIDAPGAFTVSALGSMGERLIRGLVVRNVVAGSATSAGTAIQVGAVSATQTFYTAFHLLAITGNVDLRIESAADEAFSSSTTRITFTSGTAVGSEWKTLAGAITDTWWRVRILGTSSGTWTLIVTAGIR